MSTTNKPAADSASSPVESASTAAQQTAAAIKTAAPQTADAVEVSVERIRELTLLRRRLESAFVVAWVTPVVVANRIVQGW